jgi:glycosyltransferase involved in cell wall biosynthesis
MTQWPITVVIPVKNEAENLSECLAALGGFAEIVVVDSASTDRTVEIAKAAGATVLNFRWAGGFPKKRNWVLQTFAFKTEWVLFLDADEKPTPAFKAAVAAAIAKTDHVGFWLHYRNHFMGRVLRHGVPQRKLALFRVGSGYYERIDDPGWSALDMEVHEHPVLDGIVGDIAEPVEHKDFRGLHHFIGRHNEYSSWEAHRYIALIKDQVAWDRLTPRQKLKYRNLRRWWYAPAYFMATYFWKRGFLDGGPGFIYAMFKFAYFFEIRAKILEAETARPNSYRTDYKSSSTSMNERAAGPFELP